MMRFSGILSVVLGMSLQSTVQAQTLTAEQLETRVNRQTFQINCVIRPLQTVEINSGIDGVVAEVFVRPGDRISKGAPLARLDSDLAKADLNVAEARAASDTRISAAELRLKALQRTEQRLATARARRAVSQADYDAAKLSLDDAQAQLTLAIEDQRLAKIEADRTRIFFEKSMITSPVTGIVGEDLVDPGEGTTGRALATIYVNQPLRVEAFVPAQQIDNFLARETFEIVVNGRQDAPQRIELDYAAQVADLASNTIGVFFKLENDAVRPGSKCYIVGGQS